MKIPTLGDGEKQWLQVYVCHDIGQSVRPVPRTRGASRRWGWWVWRCAWWAHSARLSTEPPRRPPGVPPGLPKRKEEKKGWEKEQRTIFNPHRPYHQLKLIKCEWIMILNLSVRLQIQYSSDRSITKWCIFTDERWPKYKLIFLHHFHIQVLRLGWKCTNPVPVWID